MFTVCPKCALTLVVTAADLRVAQGYVRCGRCLNVFNALARLSEERPALSPEPPPGTTAAGSPGQTTSPEPSESSSTADDTGEIEIELDASVLGTSSRAPAALEETAEHEVPVDSPGATAAVAAVPETSQPASAATTFTEETRTPLTSAAPVPSKHDDAGTTGASALAIASERPPGNPLGNEVPSQHDAAVQPTSAESSPPADQPEAPDGQQTNTPQQQPEGSFELEAGRPRAALGWKLGTGALAIALALQLVNHYRDSLAATSALRGPLSTVYSALGVKLAPRWDIHAYDVRQLGASVAGAAAGEIVVRASVKNSASRAQPLPLLRVTLQDRFGNRIAARDVPPGDYLPSSAAASALLAAGGRVDATMVFVDPGPQAVGFEIDACLRQHSGEVACAHGP